MRIDEQLGLLEKLLELDDLQIVFAALIFADAFIRSQRKPERTVQGFVKTPGSVITAS